MQHLSFWTAIEGLLLRRMDSLRKSLSYLPHFCHQWEERSFSYKGHPFPVCARCTGVYFGQCVSIGLFTSFWPISASLWALVALMVPMGIDWSIQEFLGIQSTNLRRFVTGFFGGFGFYGLGMTIVYNAFLFLRSLV